MGIKIAPAEYVKPVPAQKENPYVSDLEAVVTGVDAAFDVTFTADEYKADKLLVQRAVNLLGYSAREVQTDWNDDKSGKQLVNSTFLVRPARKRKAGETDAEAAAAEDAAE